MAGRSSYGRSAALNMLGKGFDVSLSHSFKDTEEALTGIVLFRPKDILLDAPEIVNRYTGYDQTISEHYARHQQLTANLQATFTAVTPVKLEVEAGWSDTVTWDQDLTFSMEQMHTRTVRFNTQMISNIPRILAAANADDQHSIFSPFTARELEPVLKHAVEANGLNDCLQSLAKDKTIDSLEDKIAVCKELLRSNRVNGATYFVSAVRLGGKIIDIKITQAIAQATTKTVDVTVETPGGGGGVQASRGTEQIRRQTSFH